jgi:hypothetical protein
LNALFVWVNASRAPKIIVCDGDGIDIAKGFHAGADEQSARHLRVLHGLANIA